MTHAEVALLVSRNAEVMAFTENVDFLSNRILHWSGQIFSSRCGSPRADISYLHGGKYD